MTYRRLAYDDAATPTQMVADAVAVGRTLTLVPQRGAALTPFDPSLHHLGDIVVPDDLAALAGDLHLHFD